ncbi:Transposase [Streptomyces sp. 3213]|nr:Transposase [Streptomyces sp. 3213] [Streptomyces sp. 3213.3]
MPGVVAVVVELDEAVRERLIGVTVSAKAQVREVLRARIVLAAAEGLGNGAIAGESAVTVNTVRKWRGRFALQGPDGLKDACRSGRPKAYGPDVRVAIVAGATGAPPHPAAAWSHRTIAAQVADTDFAAISASQVGRIPADLDLKPHRVRGRLTRRDTPDFRDRVADNRLHHRPRPSAHRHRPKRGTRRQDEPDDHALGRCRGELATRTRLDCDGRGPPLAVVCTADHCHDAIYARTLRELIRCGF